MAKSRRRTKAADKLRYRRTQQERTFISFVKSPWVTWRQTCLDIATGRCSASRLELVERVEFPSVLHGTPGRSSSLRQLVRPWYPTVEQVVMTLELAERSGWMNWDEEARVLVLLRSVPQATAEEVMDALLREHVVLLR